ncbi:glycosyltransferase family 4 protein [Lutispora thermophila]|uniref:Glycosyltransferase involved in cell wall bisynthesis n=1 Tax=Lutispora thermophila DSM 19022 TaxID=1122184 RepID=A0A1M6BXD9_9FIRM|nr:glycosyltransferase family 4 protein [Lutispora thermophila]SHI53465.1 Glycosyltransferase involved in cell wall bisynthesis [Lutispora thermophila DSM 19022]
MKILWLVNIPLPEASLLMGEKPLPYGGWLLEVSKFISKREDVDLYIAFPHKRVNKYRILYGENIIYYAFKHINERNYKSIRCKKILECIFKEVKPDLVHVYGTELLHTLAFINICRELDIKVVISIQGLVSVISRHMYAGLPFRAIYGATVRNILLKDNVSGLKNLFAKRGKLEIEAIKRTNHIIGRTTWDKACISQINPNAKYYFCNETLRNEFYKHSWELDKCEKHSIFLSQCQYPIKGLHYVLEALAIILRQYPDAKLYVSGKNIIKSDTIKDKMLMTYYGRYIKKMIMKLGLENSIVFTGVLDEKSMCEAYLKSHVFVCASSIENSPNSLGEAMILGVPCVVSDVGGISDMIRHMEEGFVYQSDAPYMLAHYICEIFNNEDLALEFSKNARIHALKTHDRQENLNRLLHIYEEFLK